MPESHTSYSPYASNRGPPNHYDQNDTMLSGHLDGSDTTLTNEDERNDKISEFYGLGKYNKKDPARGDKNRFMSDTDVRANTLPARPLTGATGEKDFRLRSLPDHVQSMPALYHEQQQLSIVVPDRHQVINSYMNLAPQSTSPDTPYSHHQTERKSAFRPLSSSGSNSLSRIPSGDMGINSFSSQGHSGDYSKPLKHQDRMIPQMAPSTQKTQNNKFPWQTGNATSSSQMISSLPSLHPSYHSFPALG